MRNWRVDVSLVCFVLVLAAAIPVALLRTKTYALGYDLGRLKSQERTLRHRNAELLFELASAQRSVRDKLISRTSGGQGASKGALALPEAAQVLHGEGRSHVR